MIGFSFTHNGIKFFARGNVDKRVVHSAWIGPPPETTFDIEDFEIDDPEYVMEVYETLDIVELGDKINWSELNEPALDALKSADEYDGDY